MGKWWIAPDPRGDLPLHEGAFGGEPGLAIVYDGCVAATAPPGCRDGDRSLWPTRAWAGGIEGQNQMRRSWLTWGAAAVAAVVAYAVVSSNAQETRPGHGAGEAGERAEPTDRERLSYGVGYYLGEEVRNGLEMDGVVADLDLVNRGFADGLNARAAAYDEDTMDAVMFIVNEEMKRRTAERLYENDPQFRALADRNLKRSRAYVTTYAKGTDVRTLREGVLYEVKREGDGSKPMAGDIVEVTFTAALADGKIYAQGEHAIFDLDDVRPTASAIVQQMTEGSKWHIVIAPEAGYGLAGDPPLVGPNEAVIVDIELHAIR
jgi:FKBP-type peptidyl-prolyl cis-trans isomerase